MFRSLDGLMFGAGLALVVGAVYLARRAGVTANTFNPASNLNAASQLMDAIIAGITGDKNQTLGGAWFDAANPRAGLAANETRNADGSISVRVASVIDTSEDYSLFGETFAGFPSSPSGAAMFRPRKL